MPVVVVVAILFICWQMPADAVFCRLFDFFFGSPAILVTDI